MKAIENQANIVKMNIAKMNVAKMNELEKARKLELESCKKQEVY